MKKLQQYYIMKFESSRLARDNFNIKVSYDRAKMNGEIIALGDNFVTRSIRKINKFEVDENKINELFRERRRLARNKHIVENIPKIKRIDQDLDNLLFIPDYISVHIEKNSHYKKMCEKGLYVNGKKYVRLLCGAGNLRVSTVFFVAENIYKELDEILNNGANPVKITYGKYNAYYALSNSSTYKVSEPRVCVVKDTEINMTKRVIWVEENDKGNNLLDVDKELCFNLFDGMGLISPRMCKIWQKDLELDYTPCAFIIRNAFVKGLVCEFDFHQFAKEVAKKNIITDIYGKEYDINEIDMIITESQFKLHKGYGSWEEYVKKTHEYEHEWGVTKFTPKRDKTSTFTNYQYLQVLNLDTPDKIYDMCKPTIDWLGKVTSLDTDYTLLYLMGESCNEDIEILNDRDFFNKIDNTELKALILNRNLIKDSFIKNKLFYSLQRKINDSCIGKLLVDGNYQFMYADPYAFCEAIFGMEIKGLLQDKEHYCKYWLDREVAKVAAMRSPLTVASEVNVLNFKSNPEIDKWYKHLYSGVVYNVWGVDTMLHSDSDFDGDIVCTTSNPTIINNVKGGLPITYQKHACEKHYIDKTQLYKADLLGLNTSKIGYITNVATTIMALKELFPKDSAEYKELEKRELLCRFYQGGEIDKSKGLTVQEFPKWWCNWTPANQKECLFTKEEIDFNNKLVIDKRPYFMRYLYPKYNSDYKKYYNIYNNKCKIIFGKGLKDLIKTEYLSDKEKEFVNDYTKYSPFIESKCIMNNICECMEQNVKNIKSYVKTTETEEVFNILFNDEIQITEEEIKYMKNIYKKYNSEKNDEVFSAKDIKLSYLNKFGKECSIDKLANLGVYVNYVLYPNSNKNFCWELFEQGILSNIYKNSKAEEFYVPVEDENGVIEYRGKRYINKKLEVLWNDNI